MSFSIRKIKRELAYSFFWGCVFLGGVIVALSYYVRSGNEGRVPLAAHDQLIKISSEIREKYEIKTIGVEEKELKEEILLPGRVDYNYEQMAIVGARLTGRITGIRVKQGDPVRAGSVLATISSIELGRAQSDYLRNLARLFGIQPKYDRARDLFEKRILSSQDFEQSRMEFQTAQVELNASRLALSNLGMRPDEIAALSQTNAEARDHILRSPINGIVTERRAVIGQSVSPADNLFVIADLSRLWVILDVYEKDMRFIQQGARVMIFLMENSEKMEARVANIGSVIDPEKKTAVVRVEVPNPGNRLRIGQTINATVEGLVNVRANLYSLPAEAIHHIEGRKVVFVERSVGAFEPREIETGETVEGRTIVVSGLKPGESVASAGSFIVKSEYLKLK